MCSVLSCGLSIYLFRMIVLKKWTELIVSISLLTFRQTTNMPFWSFLSPDKNKARKSRRLSDFDENANISLKSRNDTSFDISNSTGNMSEMDTKISGMGSFLRLNSSWFFFLSENNVVPLRYWRCRRSKFSRRVLIYVWGGKYCKLFGKNQAVSYCHRLFILTSLRIYFHPLNLHVDIALQLELNWTHRHVLE